jgi:hypothetical protein
MESSPAPAFPALPAAFASPALSALSTGDFSELSPTTERRVSAAQEIAQLRRAAREAELKMQAADEEHARLEAQGTPSPRQPWEGLAEVSLNDDDIDDNAAASSPAEFPTRVPNNPKEQTEAGGAEVIPTYSPRVGSLRTPHDVTAIFINDGQLGLQFNPLSDPPFVILRVAPDGLAAKQPQLKVGLVLKAVNGRPVEGRQYAEVFKSIATAARPLELSFCKTPAALASGQFAPPAPISILSQISGQPGTLRVPNLIES